MSQLVAADETEASEVVAGRYRLTHRLARGGMGEVFAAVDRSSGASIALKRMRTESRQRRMFEVHFMREYHAPLALLHARRLLHRDVSPRNVRRTSDGRCKLLDFGAMVPFGAPPNVTGTPPCIAPEALQGAPLDQRSDLYSLGALAYLILTGRHAYPVHELAELPAAWTQAPVNPRRIARDIPDALDALVMSLLSLDPMKRPASAAEVIDWLSAAGQLAPDDGAATARSFLAGSQLVNRDDERALLHRFMSQTLAGRGAAVLVRGAAGSGRSRMLAEAALIAQTCGLTVLRAVARKQRGAASNLIADLVTGIEQAAPLDAQRASQNRPLVQASRARSDSAHVETLAAAGGEARVQLLTELTDFFLELARVRPLLITVDDLDRADELSGALVAALAHHARTSGLAVVASYDSARQAPTLANVRGLATTLTLRPLQRAQCMRLVASLFGDVPNLERVSDWIYRVALGNPKLTLELAEHLLNEGIVRYIEGAWVLPAEIAAPVPPSAEVTLLLRLQEFSALARELAEILSVSRGGASAETLIELAARPTEAVIAALEELVGAGTLVSAGDEYVFAQGALSKAVSGSLDPSRLQHLHALWAEVLLATRQDRDGQLEAGWHLVHTDQELRGADLLAKFGPQMVEHRVSMAAAVPALERALAIYERHGRSLADCLRLRSLLVMSSYLFDHKLAARYGDDTLDALYPLTGLAEVERWSRVLGRHLGFALGMSWAVLRWCFRRPSQRGPSVLEAILYYARSAMGLVGLSALTLDPPGARACARAAVYASQFTATPRLATQKPTAKRWRRRRQPARSFCAESRVLRCARSMRCTCLGNTRAAAKAICSWRSTRSSDWPRRSTSAHRRTGSKRYCRACPRTTHAIRARSTCRGASCRSATPCLPCAPKTRALAWQCCETAKARSSSCRAHCSAKSVRCSRNSQLEFRGRSAIGLSRETEGRRPRRRQRAGCTRAAGCEFQRLAPIS